MLDIDTLPKPFFHRTPWLLCASALGALAGAALSQSRAGACSCVEPSWPVTLRSAHADGGAPTHAQAWPRTARLEAYPGRAILWSEDLTSQTIDYLLAGGP
jgi:hypothetical protein